MRRAALAAAIIAMGAGACKGGATAESTVEVTLEATVPTELGDVRDVWRRRFDALADQGLTVRSAVVTAAGERTLRVVATVGVEATCGEATKARVLRAMTEAAAASGTFAVYEPSVKAAEQVAAALRRSLGELVTEADPFEVSHLAEPGAVVVRGVSWEASQAAIAPATPPGFKALRDESPALGAGVWQIWIVLAEPALTGANVKRASAAPGGDDAGDITITFNEASRAPLGMLTGRLVGGFIVMTVNGRVVSTPRLATRAGGGTMVLSHVSGDYRTLAATIDASTLAAAPTVTSASVGECRGPQ